MKTAKNLIPAASINCSNNYYCTWNTQNFGRYDDESVNKSSAYTDDNGAKNARSFMNEKHLLDERGLLNQFAAVRREIWFLVDDGWDVPYGIHPDENADRFGSLEVAVDKFPSCDGTPAKRLAKLNSLVKKAGWRGLGIWVASQAAGENWDNYLTEAESEEYWKKRLIWSNDAGIGYWKIDWGCRKFDIAWHNMIEKLAKTFAPKLIIEHSYAATPPFNNVIITGDKQVSDGHFRSFGPQLDDWVKIAKMSSVFRTYDVSAQLSQVTTIDRVSALLEMLRGSECILNCEDEVYIAAAMGLLMGVMRSGLNKETSVMRFDPQKVSKRLIEVERAVRWQRIAPAFAVGDHKVTLSDEIIDESYYFKDGDTWIGCAVGRTIYQSCPATVFRGIEPDRIEYNEDKKPLFIASRNPNGAISMATFSRVYDSKTYKTPLCTPVFSGLNADAPIGVFGYYGSIVLNYNELPKGSSVYIQDLAKDEAFCVDGDVRINGNCIEIPGELICRVCECCDASEPGAVIRII